MFKKLIFSFIFLLSYSTFSQVTYSDKASELGINLSPSFSTVLGGVSFFDFDNDGYDDLTFASKGDIPVKFFKNNNGTFQEIDFGLNITGHSKQVIWVDFDNDGDNDLFVARIDASNKLYQNNGSFQFTDITNASGLSTNNEVTYGATFGDYNNDGYLDLFVSNKDDNFVIPNKLYKNNGNGTFTDVSVQAGISSVGHLSFCATFFDYNNDNNMDIYISNDRYANKNILYKNNGDGTFSDVSDSSGAGVAANAMSTTIADFNADGYFDIYVTNTVEGNFLLKNNGDGTFSDVAQSTGTVFNTISWGALFFDAENDADLDLYVSSMMTDTNSGMLTSGFFLCDTNGDYSIPNDAGFQSDAYVSFSSSIGDVNNDGLTDFVVINRAPDNNSLWVNQTSNSNNWIKIQLEGDTSNKNGIGNLIEVRANGRSQFKQTKMGEGYLGQNSASNIFGLSSATNIEYIKITWSSTGVTDTFENITPNRKITIKENTGVLSTTDISLSTINVFPNPSNEGIYQLTLPFQNLSYVEVFDISGRLVSKKQVLDKKIIDIRNCKSGVYIARITSNNKSRNIKLIKN